MTWIDGSILPTVLNDFPFCEANQIARPNVDRGRQPATSLPSYNEKQAKALTMLQRISPREA
jgi:hypothetical protein